MFISHEDLQALGSYRNETGAISLYIYSALDDKVRDFSEKLKSLFDTMEKDIASTDWSRIIKKDAGYILNAKEKLIQNFTHNKRKTYCMFVSENFFRYYEIPIRVRDRIVVSDKFYTTPLFISLGQFHRYAVLIFNRNKARLYNYYLDKLQEETYILHDYVMSNIKAPTSHDGTLKGKTIMNKIEETFHRHLRETSLFLFNNYKARGFDNLILGAHRDMLGMMKEYLHPYLNKNITGEIIGDPDDNKIIIEAKVRQAIDSQRKEIELKRLEELSAMHAYSKAVLGIEAVLAALAQGNIRQLIMVHDFHQEGYVCPKRHFVHTKTADKKECPYCGAAMKVEHFLEDEIAEEVFLQKGEIFHIFHYPELVGLHKIGALLRHQ